MSELSPMSTCSRTGVTERLLSPRLWDSDLRWPRLWTAVGIALVLAVTIASLIRIGGPLSTILSRDKIVHLSVYLLLMLWFVQIYRRPSALWIIAGTLWLLSAAIEVFQGVMPYRELDLFDLMANTAGIVLALLLGLAGMRRLLLFAESCFMACHRRRF